MAAGAVIAFLLFPFYPSSARRFIGEGQASIYSFFDRTGDINAFGNDDWALVGFSVERAIHDEVNTWRTGIVHNELGYSAQISRIARNHSQDMVDRNFFDHESPEGSGPEVRFQGTRFRCSENILTLPSDDLTTWEVAREVVKAWAESPPHRENMAGPALIEGIGTAFDGDRDVLLVTQNLCS